MTSRYIVKVQVPVVATAKPVALVYSRDRELDMFMPITPDLLSKMHGRFKAFFYIGIGELTWELEEEAPWQTW
jgi:hypothetical protein